MPPASRRSSRWARWTDFFSSHPKEADEVRTIQQPARDYQNRCGLAVEPAEAFMALQNL